MYYSVFVYVPRYIYVQFLKLELYAPSPIVVTVSGASNVGTRVDTSRT